MFNGVYCIFAVHDVLLLFFMVFVKLCAYVDGGKKQTSNIHIFKTNIKTQHFQSLWWKQPVTFHWHWHFTAAFLFFAPPPPPLCKNYKRCQKCEIYAVFTVVTTNNMRTRKQLWTMSNLIDINISQLRFCFRPPCLVPLSGNVTYLQIPHICHPSHTSNLILFTHRIPHTS